MSARDIQRTVLHYPVLAHVIDAAATGASPTMLTRKALGFGLTSHNSQVEELGAWVNSTEGDIANIACMPDKAQRELSASVVALQVYDFKCHLESSTHWDAARRAVNWLTCQGRVAGRWIQVVPWDRNNSDRGRHSSSWAVGDVTLIPSTYTSKAARLLSPEATPSDAELVEWFGAKIDAISRPYNTVVRKAHTSAGNSQFSAAAVSLAGGTCGGCGC